MYSKFLFLFLVFCCLIFVMASNKEPLDKCEARCDRRFAKHQTDLKRKKRCYEKCGDSSHEKRKQPLQQQPRCNDGASRRGGLVRAADDDKGESRRTIGDRSKEKPKIRDAECRKSVSSSRRAGKRRAGNFREESKFSFGRVSSRIYKAPNGDFRLREIYGDGNCMFRAMSFIIWGTESKHRFLRAAVVSHIESSWRELRSFVQAEWSISSLDRYVRFMGANGTFASELECVVVSKLNRLNLAIYRRIDTSGNLRRILYSQFDGRLGTANLLFSGRNEYGHYDVLLPLS